jgi:hypothetical protein
MNCQDIFRTLDSRDVDELSSSERNACEAHALSCRDCGSEWVVYTRLSAMPTPPLSRDFVARCVAVAATQNGNITSRRPSRMVLLGTVFVVAGAAAAAMLGLQLTASRDDGKSVTLTVPYIAAPEAVVHKALDTSSVPEDAAQASPPSPPAIPESPGGTFTVTVLPLREESKDPDITMAAETYYSALLDELRKVPGLVMVSAARSATTRGGGAHDRPGNPPRWPYR